jgi:hypothetical protein
MALTKINSNLISNNTVANTNIADNAVDATKIASNSILTRHIDDAQITTDQILDDAVTADKLANAINTSIAAKLPLAGGTMTGAVSSNSSITITNGSARFIANSTSSGDYVRMYGSGGTGKWDIYGNGANLRISDNESAGLVAIDTALTVGGTLGVTGETTLSTHLNMGDSDIIKLGAGADLQIYHDGSNSYIDDAGTGGLILRADNAIYLRSTENENMVYAEKDGGVNLYFNNAAKLSTVTGGINITGDTDTDTLTVSGNATVGGTLGVTGDVTLAAHLNMGDGDTIKLGNSNGDFELYHIGGSVNVIRGAGAMVLQSDDYISLGTHSDGELMLKGTKNGALDLYYDNVVKLSTTTGGVDITGTLGVTGVTTIANTDSGQVNNESHVLIRDLANGKVITDDGLKMNCAENKFTVGGGTFITSGYIRSGAADMQFGTASQGVYITLDDSSGNVGIGTATPDDLLHVSKGDSTSPPHSLSIFNLEDDTDLAMMFLTPNTAQGQIRWADPQDDGDAYIIYSHSSRSMLFGAAAGTRMTINSNGVIDGDFNDTSDVALKENITNLTGGLSVIKQLQPRNFDWKDDNKNNGVAGFIAQEVATVLPKEVHGENYVATHEVDGKVEGTAGKSLNVTGIVAHLTKAVQELEARIATLEG